MLDQLPSNVLDALFAYRTCEFSTLGKDGTPLTAPVCPVILPDSNEIIITTSIAIPNKFFNARRDGRVSMLFSDPKASGLHKPPAVLIQGNAVAADTIETWTPELAELWKILDERQPASRMYISTRLTRWLFDWYYMRLLIRVTPHTIRWWEAGNFTQEPKSLEESYVV